MPYGRCAGVAAMRLPSAARAFAEENRAGRLRNFAVLAARGARHRADEQAARVRTAGWRHGYGGGQRIAGIRGRFARLRLFGADFEKTWRHEDSAAFEQSGEGSAARRVWH